MNKNELKAQLKNLLGILKDEKQALIKNEGSKIQAIVDEKTIIFGKIQDYKGEISQDIIDLKKEIDSLQELNLLLTKQALSYQDKLLESISENIKNVSTPYSSKGQYGDGDSINLINQKV